MYYKKNLDFVALILEDLANQIDNKDYKKQDKMFYPRFTKIIIHHFLEKDKSISMRNRTFMHTARDDSLLGTMRFVSRHEETQLYGAIVPKSMTNQAMLDSVAYKTYYAMASGAETPKSKKPKRKSDSAILFEESPSKKKPTSKPNRLRRRHRLRHINFKTMNKLVKRNLVRGKFDGKADEGFFVGYSINSKAFRVFNSRTRIVEENLHVQFSENTPNIVGSGPNWLFNIDALTKSMNYKPVVIGNQSNGNAGTKACDDAGKARMVLWALLIL
ncbi:hypothetical protein Tco_0917838 [Tanacetum coccineum]